MIPRLIQTSTALMALAFCSVTMGATPTHHELDVRLDPVGHRIEVVDTIHLGRDVRIDADGTYHMVIHAGNTPNNLFFLKGIKQSARVNKTRASCVTNGSTIL